MYQLDVDDSFVATAMYPLICGNNRTNIDANNKCDITSISAPDNIAMLQGHNELIIGEDTSDHQNDAVWLYSFDVGPGAWLQNPQRALAPICLGLACHKSACALIIG